MKNLCKPKRFSALVIQWPNITIIVLSRRANLARRQFLRIVAGSKRTESKRYALVSLVPGAWVTVHFDSLLSLLWHRFDQALWGHRRNNSGHFEACGRE